MGILVILPIAAAIALLSRKKIEDYFFLAICLVIIAILISGYGFGTTIPGYKAGVILGVISIIYCITIVFVDRDRFGNYVLTPGLWIMLIFTVLSGLILIGKNGLGGNTNTYATHIPQVLNMYRYSDIGDIGKKCKNYNLLYTTPVYTTWSYFCNLLWYEYSDGINLWSRQIFIMAAFMPCFTSVSKNEWKKLLLISLCLMVIPRMVGATYDYMPDIPTAAVSIYGTLMMIKFYRNKEGDNSWYLLGAGLCLLYACVMKRAGAIYIFGIVGITVIGTMDRIFDKESRQKFYKKLEPLFALTLSCVLTLVFIRRRNKVDGKDVLLTWLPTVCYFMYLAMGIVCFLIKKLAKGKKYISSLIVTFSFFAATTYGVLLSVKLAWQRLKITETGKIREIAYRYFNMWFTEKYSDGSRFAGGWFISDMAYILILLTVIIIVRYLIEDKKLSYNGTLHNLDNTILVAFSGYVMYMLLYLFIYVYRQSKYIRGDLFVYPKRYLGPAVMLVTTLVLYELLNLGSKYIEKILMCSVIFLMLLLPYNPFHILSIDDKIGWDDYNKMYEQAGVELTEEDCVLCLGPDHCLYYAFPAYSSRDMSAYEASTPPEEWAEKVKSFDYLLIEDYNRNFPETYKDMFEGGISSIKKLALYKIETMEDGSVKFVRCRGQL